MIDFAKIIARSAEGKAKRSTALQPCLWIFGILVAGLIVTSSRDSALWIQLSIAVAAGVVLLVLLFMYCYFAFKCPDLIRSESFVIRKMEIERAAIGDSLIGTIDDSQTSVPQLPQRQGDRA